VSWRLDALKGALRHLAAPAQEQIRYISDLGCHIDELALDFDAVAPTCQDMQELTDKLSEQIERLDQKLLAISGHKHAELWTEQGLMHAPEWVEMRMLAQDCLKELGSN
jgi:hypothetical protein